MSDDKALKPAPDKTRAKFITAALLFIWVIGVFLFTFFKFSGGR